MVSRYVGSSETFAGKSLICLALATHLREVGKRIGYIKPVAVMPTRAGGVVVDEDVAFIREALDLKDPLEAMSPIVITPELTDEVFGGRTNSFAEQITSAFHRVAKDKDVVLVGGVGSVVSTGLFMGLPAARVADLVGAKVLVVGRALSERCVDWILSARESLGDRLMGIVLNQVPPGEVDHVTRMVVPYLGRQGIQVFGVIPRDELLDAITVRELAEVLSAEILCCPGHEEELVEHFSVGAMNVESALRYFRRIPNKAVITGGDRSDIQLAALETSTKCIVLTGELHPNSIIIARAEERGIPILLTRDDTLTAVERIERFLGRQRVRSPKKIGHALDLLRSHVALDRLLAAAGIV